MKKLLAVIAISAITFSATAQQKREITKQKPGIEQGRHQGRKHHNMQLMKDLNLSDAQKKQLRSNKAAYEASIKQLKQDPNITLKAFNEKKEILKREQKAKMQALLTPEQKATIAAMKSKQEQEKLARQNRHLEEMRTKLALTDDQAARLKSQNESTYNSIKTIRENESLSRDERMKQIKDIKDASMEQRKSILTADQQKKMEEMKKERQQKDWKESKS